MKKSVKFPIAIMVVLCIAYPIILAQPLSERIVHYTMKVSLNPDEKTIDGNMLFKWKNPSNDTISELQFHMYLNAFKNTKSTFVK